MNYELAKQLKDAGFPQTGNGHGIFADGGIVNASFIGHGTMASTYVPTLEELIEACERFECLIKEPTGETAKWPPFIGENPHHGEAERAVYRWKATTYQFKSGTWFEGSTPTEAVARLWLALNKKD